MSKYKYLLWDIDGTVLDFAASERDGIKKLFVKYGLGDCSDQMVERYSAINKKYWRALECGQMTKSEILVGRFKEFFETEGFDSSIASDFNSDYQLSLGDTIAFCDNSKEILLSLKDQYVLIAVTNGTKDAQDKKLNRSGLDKIFDYIFISEDVGYEKPDWKFFDKVIKTSGITDLSTALIIGDSLTSDIKGGVNCSIDTCWYNPKNESLSGEVVPKYTVKNLHDVMDIL